jgi:hypothetical protein
MVIDHRQEASGLAPQTAAPLVAEVAYLHEHRLRSLKSRLQSLIATDYYRTALSVRM